MCSVFFFFNDTATTEIYTLSLHDALPISDRTLRWTGSRRCTSGSSHRCARSGAESTSRPDRKSTRLNSSHSQISYAVFCLKKKKIYNNSNISTHTHTSQQYSHRPILLPYT